MLVTPLKCCCKGCWSQRLSWYKRFNLSPTVTSNQQSRFRVYSLRTLIFLRDRYRPSAPGHNRATRSVQYNFVKVYGPWTIVFLIHSCLCFSKCSQNGKNKKSQFHFRVFLKSDFFTGWGQPYKRSLWSTFMIDYKIIVSKNDLIIICEGDIRP